LPRSIRERKKKKKKKKKKKSKVGGTELKKQAGNVQQTLVKKN
jgi:hypothetical protein